MRAVIFWSYAVQSFAAVAAKVHTHQSCITRLGPYFVKNVPSSTLTIDVSETAFQAYCLTETKTISPLPKTFHIAVTKVSTSTIVITESPKTDVVTTTRTSIST